MIPIYFKLIHKLLIRLACPVLVLMLTLYSGPVRAQSLVASTALEQYVMSEEDKSDVARIEAYLNSIGTVQARFVQMSSTGEMAEGEFFLSRPGDLRIDYDPPVPILIVTSGLFLVYVDQELEQSTHIPIATTPVGVLIDEAIKLNSNDVQITNVQRSANAIRVSVIQTNDPYAGMITLAFSDSPLTLRQWTVRDAQGVVTEFALLNPRFGVEIDPDLFTYTQELNTNERR